MKVDRGRLHGTHAGLDVIVAGEENDLAPARRTNERALQLESTQAGHANVEQQTFPRPRRPVLSGSAPPNKRLVTGFDQHTRQPDANLPGIITMNTVCVALLIALPPLPPPAP
jgi:hypothetical protein